MGDRPLALLAVKQITDGPPTRGIRLRIVSQLIHTCYWSLFLGLAAGRAAVRKARLIRLQLKFLSTNAASFYWERHSLIIKNPEALLHRGEASPRGPKIIYRCAASISHQPEGS